MNCGRFDSALIVVLLSGFAPACADAEDKLPFWPEADAFVKLSPNTRFLIMTAATDNRDEPKSKWEVGAYLDIFVPRFRPLLFRRISELDESRRQRLAIRTGYRFSHTWGTDPPQIEHRIVTDATFRWVLPHHILNTDRDRFEFRFVNGAYSWRYRNQFKVSRDFSMRGIALVPSVSAEGFYDSQYQTVSRYRYEAGVTLPFRKIWSLEPYYARQKSRVPSQSSTNAIGLTLDVYFQ
jgi:hypothetical protein